MQRIKFSIKHLSDFAHKNLFLVNKMAKTSIIIYRGFNIEAIDFGRLTAIEVIGNYTGNFKDAKADGVKHKADKLTADIVEEKGNFDMTVNLQDENWIYLGATKKQCSSIDECIEYMKRCIDRYLFRE